MIKNKTIYGITRKRGKRAVAERILEGAAKQLMEQGYKAPKKAIAEAVQLASPMVSLRSENQSGQTIQVPIGMSVSRQQGMGIRILHNAEGGKGAGRYTPLKYFKNLKTVYSKTLAQEVVKVLNNDSSGAMAKRNSLHRMAVSQLGSRSVN